MLSAAVALVVTDEILRLLLRATCAVTGDDSFERRARARAAL